MHACQKGDRVTYFLLKKLEKYNATIWFTSTHPT